MSEPDEKKELTGLARSIDQLFAKSSEGLPGPGEGSHPAAADAPAGGPAGMWTSSSQSEELDTPWLPSRLDIAHATVAVEAEDAEPEPLELAASWAQPAATEADEVSVDVPSEPGPSGVDAADPAAAGPGAEMETPPPPSSPRPPEARPDPTQLPEAWLVPPDEPSTEATESIAELEQVAEVEPGVEVEPVAEVEPVVEPVPSPPEPEPESPRSPGIAQEAVPPEVAAPPRQPSPEVVEVEETAGQGAQEEEVEFVPTALELAVEAYLEGDRSRVSEIDRLGHEMLDARDIDPIVRAVVRLMLAAGEPPDASIAAVAQPLLVPSVLTGLARRIGSERVEEHRRELYQVSRVIGPAMARAVRDDLADTTDRLARRLLCETLVEMGAAARPTIEEMAADENRFLARNAIVILGDLGGERAVEIVTEALASPDARIRREALRSLAKLGEAASGPLVVGLLDDTDDEVRIAAAVAAGELKAERAVKPIMTMLDESRDMDRALPLIRALGHLGDPGAVPSIERYAVKSLFSRPPTDVRIAAYRALHQIGTPHARKLLNRAIDDRDPKVKAAVKSILHLR